MAIKVVNETIVGEEPQHTLLLLVRIELINPVYFGKHRRSYCRFVVASGGIAYDDDIVRIYLADGLRTIVIPRENVVLIEERSLDIPVREDERFCPYAEYSMYAGYYVDEAGKITGRYTPDMEFVPVE